MLLCFASQSAQVAVDWLRQGLSKGSTVLRFCLCFASHPWQIALKLLHDGCDLKVRNCRTHCVFLGKRRLRCGEQLARVRDGLWRRRFAVSGSKSACSVTEGSRWLFLFFVDAVLLCFASQSVQVAVDWLRQGLSKGSNVLRFCLCFASHPWQIALELLHDGCDLNVRNCRTHCVFFGKRRLRCGEKLARVRYGLRHRRFAVEVGSICVRRCNWVPGDFSSLLVLCVCVLQFSLCRSQWMVGARFLAVAAWCVIVFRSWESNRTVAAAWRLRMVLCQQIFPILALMIFPLKFLSKKVIQNRRFSAWASRSSFGAAICVAFLRNSPQLCVGF